MPRGAWIYSPILVALKTKARAKAREGASKRVKYVAKPGGGKKKAKPRAKSQEPGAAGHSKRSKILARKYTILPRVTILTHIIIPNSQCAKSYAKPPPFPPHTHTEKHNISTCAFDSALVRLALYVAQIDSLTQSDAGRLGHHCCPQEPRAM